MSHAHHRRIQASRLKARRPDHRQWVILQRPRTCLTTGLPTLRMDNDAAACCHISQRCTSDVRLAPGCFPVQRRCPPLPRRPSRPGHDRRMPSWGHPPERTAQTPSRSSLPGSSSITWLQWMPPSVGFWRCGWRLKNNGTRLTPLRGCFRSSGLQP